MELYKQCSFVAVILILWFRTEVVIEYGKMLRMNWLLFYSDYEELKKQDLRLTYLGYLRQYHNNFFTRLITCPICLSVWLSILVGSISTIPFIIIGGLMLYLIVDKLLG